MQKKETEKLPWELEEEILSLLQPKSLARFRSVCRRWNALFDDMRFVKNQLARARPQFILLSESMICSVEVNLEDPSIKVHKLPSDIPNYQQTMPTTIEYCEGLLIYATRSINGFGICNPWLRRIRWIESIPSYRRYNGMGYDNSIPGNHYKIFGSDVNGHTLYAKAAELGSNAEKLYEFSAENWNMDTFPYSVSLNGTLYWVAFHHDPRKHFIQSFDFSTESLKPYCNLPGRNDTDDVRALMIFRGDGFSFLEQDHNSRNIEVWVTKNKIQNGEGEAVEWIKYMSVLVPKWSSMLVEYYPPSYFIDEKSGSLVFCCHNDDKTCIYIAKGDKFHEIKIDELVGYRTRHRTYFPNLVPLPPGANDEVTYTMDVKARQGSIEWDDGSFDNVKKVSVGQSHFGVAFVKFDYSKDKALVVGAAHGNATHIPDPHNDLLIDDDDYIEAVEGTYTESHITSLAFRLHKTKIRRHYGLKNGTPFVLRGGHGSKIIGFYGTNSTLHHLTALGVHLHFSI